MNLLILDQFAEDYKRRLESKFSEVDIYTAKEESELGESVERIDILLTGKISDPMIRKASRLQWIQAKTSGVDYILNLPSLRKGILVTCARGIHGPQMSEMAILLMLALNRNLPQIIRNQDKRIWDRWPGKLLYGKTVGILGIGVIGEEIARKCKVFGMMVIGIDIVRRKVDSVDHFYGPEKLFHVIQEVDYFIIVAPSTPETQRMIGSQLISRMKSTAYLINLGRGEIIEEDALIDALRKRKIAGAAIDTFIKEPLPEDNPLWCLDNLIVTPHVGGLSDIYVEQVLSIFEENLIRFLQGERRNLINVVER